LCLTTQIRTVHVRFKVLTAVIMILMSPSSGLNMQTICFSERLVSAYKITRHQNPKQHQHQFVQSPFVEIRTSFVPGDSEICNIFHFINYKICESLITVLVMVDCSEKRPDDIILALRCNKDRLCQNMEMDHLNAI
jgi:hypothetical protein